MNGIKHWGEFDDSSEDYPEITEENIITPSAKAEKLKKIKDITMHAEEKLEEIRLENSLVTQTIEVMNQTEMLQTLIDTYANKNGFNNYLLNPCQMIPQVDFPPENTANLLNDDKFTKPIWFIPPINTDFSRGVKRKYPHVNKKICRELIRKSVCGLSRVVGFNDITNSALNTFTDAVDEFLKNLLEQVNDVKMHENTDNNNKLEILTLEKAYFTMTQKSLMSIHNYFKNDIIARNRSEISEFNNIYHEYDKMMKESQNIKYRDDNNYVNFMDYTTEQNTSNEQQPSNSDVNNLNMMNLLKTENGSNVQGNFQNIFESGIIETQTQQECIPVASTSTATQQSWSIKR